MTAKREQGKWTATQVKDQIQKIQQLIEKRKRERKEEHFTVITPEEIEKKLKRVKSPMIVGEGWSDTTPGGTLPYGLDIYNPGPTHAYCLFAHVWVGSSNVDPTVGTFLLNVDTRFPRLTQPKFGGLSLGAGELVTLSFALKVPATVEKTSYLGNSCLMQFNWHDVGTYLDRGTFVFTVS